MDLEGLRWEGYLRQDGALGIRNKVLVVYTVECAQFVAEEIARRSGDAETEVIGFAGCTDNAYAIRMLLALIRHPNVGAVLAVGLGCEYTQPERLAEAARKAGKPAEWFFIQDVGGTKPAIEKGVDLAVKLRKKLADTPRAPMGMSDLVVGAECGGSDYTSGLAGNVAVGRFYDLLCDLGGTAVFEEIVEAVGLGKQLAARAATPAVREELLDTYQKALDYCKSVRQYSVSPGNFAGGLSTIEEKSMGAVIKSGSRPLQGVLKVGERAGRHGLWLLDTTPDPHWMQFGITNPNDNEGLMALIASGCHLAILKQLLQPLVICHEAALAVGSRIDIYLAQLCLCQPRGFVGNHLGVYHLGYVAADVVVGQCGCLCILSHDGAIRHQSQLDQGLEAVADTKAQAVSLI